MAGTATPALARWNVMKPLAGIAAGTAIWGAVLFAAAGRLDFPNGWAAIALSLLMVAANAVTVSRRNPALLAERWKKRENTKPYDKVFRAVFTPMIFVIPLMAGLGVRLSWPALPFWAACAGAALLLIGDVPVLGSMLANPYLETTVRIQEDRGHQVVTDGPYRFVRHPMYVGIILQQAGTAALLGSSYAFFPVAIIVLAFVIRTALEDRTLRTELPGYAEYATSTRWRLVPGIW